MSPHLPTPSLPHLASADKASQPQPPHELSTAHAAAQARLIKVQAQLLARMASERGGVRSRAEVAAEHFDNSTASRAQIRTERQTEFAMNEHETAELRDIAAALARLQAGTYGLCSDCGVAIAAERLQAYPIAHRCLDCQSLAEHHR